MLFQEHHLPFVLNKDKDFAKAYLILNEKFWKLINCALSLFGYSSEYGLLGLGLGLGYG